MISINDVRSGMAIELDGDLYICVEHLHVKPGKGAAFVRTRLKNLKDGTILEKTFRAGEKIIRAYLEGKKMQYLYRQDGDYIFMDQSNYEQWHIKKDDFRQGVEFLKEGLEAEVLFYQGKPIGVDLPIVVELIVQETDPGFKGDTVSGATKQAVLETGAKISVPLFVEIGDIIRIDTRSGEYLERIKAKEDR
ncbi:MAG: Elongation factor P [candidate division WS2 bacterium]|nr:Elongation factor P [Candidatus Lithacetigena glycinireducens]